MRFSIFFILILINACVAIPNNPPTQEYPKIAEYTHNTQKELIEPPPDIITYFKESQKQEYPPIRIYIYKDININEVKKFMILKEKVVITESKGIKISEKQYFFDGLVDVPSLKDYYLDGLDYVYITYMYNCGYFDGSSITNGIIHINMNCNSKTNIFLHELEHLWCYKNTGDLEADHNGCFLDNPIMSNIIPPSKDGGFYP